MDRRIYPVTAGLLWLVASLATSPAELQAQQAWYWLEIAQNDSVVGGDVVVEMKVASDRDPDVNRLLGTTLDLEFDSSRVQYVGAAVSDLTLHNDTTAAYDIFHTLTADTTSRLLATASFFADLQAVGFEIGLDPRSIAAFRFEIKVPFASSGDGVFMPQPSSIIFSDFVSCGDSNPCRTQLEAPSAGPMVHFKSRVLLQGAYASSGTMSTEASFAGLVPTTQPYSDSDFDGTPMEYDSAMTATSLPAGTIDWVIVSLRTGLDPSTEVTGSRRAAILLQDGSIVGLDGYTVNFPGVAPGLYHLVVRHRNHLAVMTPSPVDLSDGLAAWDFTPNASQAHMGSKAPMRDLGDGFWGMVAGESALDGASTIADFASWLVDAKGAAEGYLLTDYNLDGEVDISDFAILLANMKAAMESQVPETPGSSEATLKEQLASR